MPAHPKFRLALGGRQFAHGGREKFVPDFGANAFSLEKVPRVVDCDAIEGTVDALQSLHSASALAAQMKSFSERPPMACVEYSTRHLL